MGGLLSYGDGSDNDSVISSKEFYILCKLIQARHCRPSFQGIKG